VVKMLLMYYLFANLVARKSWAKMWLRAMIHAVAPAVAVAETREAIQRRYGMMEERQKEKGDQIQNPKKLRGVCGVTRVRGIRSDGRP